MICSITFENGSQRTTCATFLPEICTDPRIGTVMSKNLMLHRTKCDIDLKIQNESGKPGVTIRCLGMTMKDIVVDLDLGSPEEDALLSATLDAFVIEQLERDADEGPEMMVRTAFRPTGEMCKEIVFQSQKWAEAFQSYWESQKMQVSAA